MVTTNFSLAAGFHGGVCVHDLREVIDPSDGHDRGAGGDGVQEVLEDLRGEVPGFAAVGARRNPRGR